MPASSRFSSAKTRDRAIAVLMLIVLALCTAAAAMLSAARAPERRRVPPPQRRLAPGGIGASPASTSVRIIARWPARQNRRAQTGDAAP